MIAAIGAWAAKSVLMQSPVGGFLKRFWKPLLIGLAVLAAVLWHSHQVKAAHATWFKAGYDQRVSEEKAIATKRADRDAAITAPIRRKADETIRATNRHADALRLRGPGAAAACVNPPAPAAGGSVAGSGQADAAVDRVPGEERVDLIALPFAATVDGLATCDANLAELKAWREQREKLDADRRSGERLAEPQPSQPSPAKAGHPPLAKEGGK